MTKTRAQLLRDLKSGTIGLEMVERFGDSKHIHENFKSVRTVKNVNTVGCVLVNKDGKESSLEIPKASLIEYTDNELSIFNPGYRELNQKEKEILKEWEKIENTKEYKEQALADVYSDGSTTYWKKKRFFEDHNADYLFTGKGGKRLDYNKLCNNDPKCLVDPAVKGQRILAYKVVNLEK